MDGVPNEEELERRRRSYLRTDEPVQRRAGKPIRSVEDIDAMAIPGFFRSDEDLERFLRLVREWRNADLA
jgi:hypothetical protein